MVNTCNEIAYGQSNRSLYLYTGSGLGSLWLRHACSFRGIQASGLAPLDSIYLDCCLSVAEGILSSDEGRGPGIV